MKDDQPEGQKSTHEIPATPLALEGYAILHQMFRIRRASWRALDEEAQTRLVAQAAALLGEMQKREDGESACFSQLGHKGDLMLVHFRRTFEELNQAEIAIANLELADYLEPTTSYLSVIELGLYEASVALYKDLVARNIEPHSKEWDARRRGRARAPARKRFHAAVSENSAAAVPLFLSDGQKARGR